MQKILTILREPYFSNVVLMLTLLLTFFIWLNDKRNKEKSYAQIILLQIKNIEITVQEIKINGLTNGILSESLFLELPILFEKDYWEEYSHFLIKDLGKDNYEKINNFYQCCSKIKNYQIEVKTKLREALYWRGYHFYNTKYQNDFNVFSTDELRKQNELKFNILEKTSVPQTYIPNEFPRQLTNLLIEYSPITDTIAYTKLQKISNRFVL
ncbi:hypothetical protein [Fusobacterium sp. SYSU M8D902]|uniref:hypothetical protein n=1 Tax=Fusobacterium sp. SYSU M8D902 TaxID=3159562 RepID=UPI0032E4AA7F